MFAKSQYVLHSVVFNTVETSSLKIDCNELPLKKHVTYCMLHLKKLHTHWTIAGN